MSNPDKRESSWVIGSTPEKALFAGDLIGKLAWVPTLRTWA
jgi:hypothetical protein